MTTIDSKTIEVIEFLNDSIFEWIPIPVSHR